VFLVPTLPHDTSRLGIYCQALLAAFNAASFERFYADVLGKILENEVDTAGGFQDVLFRLLLKSQHDGTLRELLVTALCYRAGNPDLVEVMDDVLAVQPIVNLATILSERQYPPQLGQEVTDALYAERRVRKRPWTHREGRAAWIEVLVICDKLPANGEPSPPLITCLNTIDQRWSPQGNSTVLRRQIDKICTRYGISSADGTIAATSSMSMPAIPLARVVEDAALGAHDRVREGRVLSTLKSGWRAATSDGQGSYQFAMISFGVAAFLFHHSLQPLKREQEYLRRNLDLQQEPLRAGRYPVLDNLLLPSKDGHGKATSGAHQLCNRELVSWLDEAYKKFRAEYLADPSYKEILTRTNQAATDGLGSSWTDSSTSTTLLIPSSLAYASERRTEPRAPASPALYGPAPQKGSRTVPGPQRPSDPCTASGPENQLHCSFREQIEHSLAISALSKFLGKKPGAPEMPRISSFYFITPEGIQRSNPYFQPSLLPAHRIFNGESYVYRTLSYDGGIFSGDGPAECKGFGTGEFNRTGTYPYFDLLGSGVQETACYPVNIASGSSKPKVVGVLCADIAVPFEVVLSRLEEASDTFDLSLVKLSKGGADVQSCRDFSWANFWHIPNRQPAIEEQPCSSRLSRIDDAKSARLARDYYNTRLKNSRDDPFGTGGVTPIPGANYFGVIVAAATPDKGPWYIAIGKHHASKSRNYASLTLCTLTLLVGVSVLVLSFRRKLKRQQALLARGLHYGLLEIDDGRIIGANDRAEEILLTDLPRLGIHASSTLKKKTLSGMLEEERCVLVPASGQLRESDIRTYDHTIKDRTSDGLTSTFYAWVKLRRSWVKIISTVILMPDSREHVLCTLDTNIDEAHRLFLANLRQGDR